MIKKINKSSDEVTVVVKDGYRIEQKGLVNG